MAGFKVEVFKGIRPRIAASKLPDGEAVRAENARIGSANLKPLNGKTSAATNVSAGDTSAIYKFDNNGSPVWFEWTSDVDVARGPIKDDALERTYYTGDGAPKYTYYGIADGGGGGPYPEDWRYIGVPAPTTAPTISATALPEDADQSERLVSAVEVNTFTIGNVDYTNYLSQVGATGVWSYNSSNGTVLFDFPTGTVLRVLTVDDANTVTVEAASGEGYIAQSNSSASYSKSMNDDGSGEDADWTEWRTPNMILTITGHNLRVGDAIRVTRLTYTGGLRFTPNPSTQKFYEQSWDTPALVYDGGSSSYQVSAASVAADSMASTNFALNDSFYYEVDRTLSTISESEERYYVYTFVNSLGEEGPPSPVSTVIECLDGDTVSVTGLETPPSAGYDITDIRIYRTNSTEDGAEYQLVKEISVAGSTSDTVDNVDLGEVLPSASWDPPDSNMVGIISMPNGMMAGFYGKTVYFCEPYFPHAWPTDYDQAVDFEIVGLAAVGNTLIVLTEGHPYMASGVHPSNMNLRPYKSGKSCASKFSIATDADSCYYASYEGLEQLGISGAQTITSNWCTKEEWTGFLPTTIKGQIIDGRYVGFYDSDNSIPQGAASLVTTGTATGGLSAAQMVTGGKTLILTLTNDYWVEETNNEFANARQDIIDNIVSSSSGTAEWNALRKTLSPSDVVRTSDSVVTITLPALASYALSGLIEVIRCTAPGIALKVNRDAGISSSNVWYVEDAASYTSEFMAVASYTSQERPVTAHVGAGDPTDTYEGKVTYVGAPSPMYHNYPAGTYDVTNAKYVVGVETDSPNTDEGLPVYEDQSDAHTTNGWAAGTAAGGGASSRYYSMYYDAIDAQVIAGIEGGVVEYSTDGGATWTDVSNFPATAEDIQKILYGGDYVYAIGNSTFGARSPNLSTGAINDNTWASMAMTWGGDSSNLVAAASGNGNVIVLGDSTTAIEINYCAHGASAWSQDDGTAHGETFDIVGVVFGGGRFVAVSGDFKVSYADAGDETTADNWSTPTQVASTVTVVGITYDQGSDGTNGVGFIVFGALTATGAGIVYTSRDGENWVQRFIHSVYSSTEYYDCIPRYPESSLD